MRVIYEIAIRDNPGLRHHVELSLDSYNKVEEVAPNQSKAQHLNVVKLPEGSPELAAVLEIIKKETGLVPQRTAKFEDEDGVFRCLRQREYDKHDISAAELLLIDCDKKIATPAGREHGSSGRFLVHYDETYRPDRGFGCAETHESIPFVSDSFLKVLQAGGFPELHWEEVLTKPPKPQEASGLWRITSSIVMPSIQNELRTHRGKPFEEDPLDWVNMKPDKGCRFVEGPYLPAEPCFKRKDVKALGPFNIARSKEQFGRWASAAAEIILVSQDFRRFLKKQFKVSDKNFIPVRLDD